MPDNKLVIRRLPPSMSENDFLKQVSPLPDHDYFCFFGTNSGLGTHSFSRAYINFLNLNDMSVFRERFDNYIFLDKDGHEYSAVVEQSFWHKSPKSGPFYKRQGSESTLSENSAKVNELDSDGKTDQNSKTSGNKTPKDLPTGLEDDPDFLNFIEKLQAQRKRPQHSPIQTLETNLDELTNSGSATNSGNNKDSSKVITPLIGYVNQQRSMRGSKRTAK